MNTSQVKNELKEIILQHLEKLGTSKTICPSEAARSYDQDNWRHLMDTVRKAASELKRNGKIEIYQDGESVQMDSVNGPIRLGLVEQDSDR